MAFVVTQQRRLHYDLEGERGPYLLLYPPLWLDLNCWETAGYLQELTQDFRVILVDPLGQGRSDTPHEASFYTPEARCLHLETILQELGLDNLHFLGFGVGAQVGFCWAARQPYRLRSVATFGAHPYAWEPEEIAASDAQQTQLAQAGWAALAADIKQWRLTEEQTAQLHERDTEKVRLALRAAQTWEGVKQELPEGPSAPGMLFTSTKEAIFLRVREAARSQSYWRYHIFPELEYEAGLLRAESFLPVYLDFVRRQRWVPRLPQGEDA